MNFVHLSIFAGLAAASIPVMLHLLGRREPQLVHFPALRFVRQTHLEQSAAWNLRHFLLLLLRVLLVGTLVFALARPSVHSAMMGSIIGISSLIVLALVASLVAAVAKASHRPLAIWGTALAIAAALWLGVFAWGFRSFTSGPSLPAADIHAPVAAVLIVDTSPSMAYQANNQSRLDAAKEMADWLIDRFPADSHLGILTDVPMSSLAFSPRAAANQLTMIQKTTDRVDLLSRIRTAMDLVLADELQRKEIYVLTDGNAAAWANAQPELAALLDQHQDEVLIQIIDVGVTHPVNWQLGDPKVDFHTVPVGSDVTIRVPVTQSFSTGGSNTVTVELWQEAIDPRLPVIHSGKLQLPPSSVVAREVIEFTEDATAEVEFTAKELSEGTHHFTIRLDKNDPLVIDNERFVSILARPLQPTLIVADDPEVRRVLKLIVDPYGGEESAGEGEITTLSYSQLPQAQFARYAVVVLFDVPTLADNVVQSLREHAVGGGGLLLILGPGLEATAGSQGETSLSALLPGMNPRVLNRPRTDRNAFWQPTALSHPIYQELEFPANEIAWQLMPIFKSWNFAELQSDVQTLAALSTGEAPLMTAHPMGRGQILTLLTPIPELERTGQPLWNELWISDQYWWAFGIVSGSIRTLSGADQQPLTYSAGSEIVLSNESGKWPTRWELYTPQAQRLSLEAIHGSLDVSRPTDPGIYHLRGVLGVPVARGFAVNVPAADTSLQPVPREQLDELLGPSNYRIARERGEVESSVGQARFGRELYPLLMLFVAGIFLAEQVMSNRFYKIRFK